MLIAIRRDVDHQGRCAPFQVGYPLNRERVFLLRTKSGSATIVKDEVSIGTLRARRGREEELWHSSSSLGASSRPQRMIVLWHSGLVGCCIYMSQVVLETRVLLARTARWPGANREPSHLSHRVGGARPLSASTSASRRPNRMLATNLPSGQLGD